MRECTPTLIIKADDAFYAAIIAADTRISFKKLKAALNAKNVTLADPATIQKLTNARIGYVSLINPLLPTLIDTQVLRNDYCYGGFGVPQKTLRIKTEDLVNLTKATVLEFAELK